MFSLAKIAVFNVLSRKASRFKDVVHLLKTDLDRGEYRKMSGRFEKVIAMGREMIKGARH